jgi:hypothetical protein
MKNMANKHKVYTREELLQRIHVQMTFLTGNGFRNKILKQGKKVTGHHALPVPKQFA